MKIPGIYVEIRGDFYKLEADMRKVNALVKSSAEGMSNALNNALDPGQIQSGITGLVRNLGQVKRASQLAGDEFSKIGVDLGELRKHTGLTEQSFQKLQSAMLQNRAAQATETALRKIQQATGLTRAEMAKLRSELGMETKFSLGSSISDLKNTLGFAGIAVSIGSATYALKEFYTTLYQTGLQLDNVRTTYSTVFDKMGASEMKYVANMAEKLGLELTGLERSYVKLTAATKGSTFEGNATKKIFEALASAGSALKLSADDMNLAFLAIEQMISKGKISAEELRRQLAERIPGAFRDAAQSIGVTTGELDKMLKAGDLLAEDLLPRLADLWQEKYGRAAVNAADKAQAATNRLANAWTDFKREMADSGFMDDMVDAVITLSERLQDPGLRSAMADIAGLAGQIATNIMNAAANTSKLISGIQNAAKQMQESLNKPHRNALVEQQIGLMKMIVDLMPESMKKQLELNIPQPRWSGKTSDQFQYDIKMDSEFRNEITKGIDEGYHTTRLTMEDVAKTILQAQQNTGIKDIDYRAMMAIAQVESGFDPNALSSALAKGLMQIQQSTADQYEPGVDLTDPLKNAEIGLRYFSDLLKQYNGDIDKARMAWNAGPGNLKKYGGSIPFPETQKFLEATDKAMKEYGYKYENTMKKNAENQIKYEKAMVASTQDAVHQKLFAVEWERDERIKNGMAAEDANKLMELEKTKILREQSDKRVEIDAEAADKIKKASLEKFEYQKWHLDQELKELEKKNWTDIQLAEYKSARLKEIAKDEAEATEKAAKKSSGAASRGAASAARAENDRLKVLNKLRGETIKLTESEYKYKMTMLQQYADEIKKKYGDDKEIMDALAENIKAKMEERQGGFSLRGFTKDIGKAMKDMANDFGDSLADMVVDGESSFDDIYKSFAKMIIKMAWQKLVIDNLFGGSGLLSGLFGSSTAATAAARGAAFDSGGHHVPNSQFAARGAVFAGDRAQFFGRGGIVSEMTPFAFRDGGTFRPGVMGEDGDEAIMPLGNVGGKLGINAKGLGGKTEVKVIINNNAPDTKATASQDDQGNVTVMIEQVESALAGRMKRGTGLAGTLDARYMKRR
jgi:tape measure domain-containing protein